MKTYLITGGAGFIGSHLAESLLADGHTVLVIDDLSTGSLDNVKHLLDNPRFEVVNDSVMNVPVISGLVAQVDYIFHLAAVVGVQRVLDSPIQTIHTIVRGTDIVLELASKHDKVVYLASTSEVYGKSADLPFKESGDLLFGATNKGRWSYACSKALDEYLALAYHRERGLSVVVGRHFNTVGPRQSAQYGMVLPRFIEQALAGRPLTVYADGSQQRCFCYVGDVISAIKQLITQPESYGQVFNIGSSEEISILQLAKLVKEKTRSSAEIIFVPYDVAYDETFEDMRRRIPDLSRIQKMIGYYPRVSLTQIIEKIMESHYVAT